MVELGVNNLMKPWPYKTIPRIIKTHKCYWPFFRKAGGSIGIIRDPRDVMVSSFHFKKYRQKKYAGHFPDFIRNRNIGLEAWFKHYMSWKDHWHLVVRYEDLKKDTLSEFNRILDFLRISYSEEIVIEAINRSSANKIRKIEEESIEIKKPEMLFVRDGSTQQWKFYFSKEDIAYYDELRKKFKIKIYSD